MQCLFHNILLNTGRKYTTTARKVPKQLRLLPIIKLQPTVYTMSDSFVADSEPEREEERKRLKSQKRQKRPAVSDTRPLVPIYLLVEADIMAITSWC